MASFLNTNVEGHITHKVTIVCFHAFQRGWNRMEWKGMEIMTFGVSMVVGDAGTIFFVALNRL